MELCNTRRRLRRIPSCTRRGPRESSWKAPKRKTKGFKSYINPYNTTPHVHPLHFCKKVKYIALLLPCGTYILSNFAVRIVDLLFLPCGLLKQVDAFLFVPAAHVSLCHSLQLLPHGHPSLSHLGNEDVLLHPIYFPHVASSPVTYGRRIKYC